MKVLIAGANGFIGHILVKALKEEHNLILLGRDKEKLEQQFPDQTERYTWKTLETFDPSNVDLIINLSGKNISASPWSEGVKNEIIASRVETNHILVNWVLASQARPRFFSANAVGIYGPQINTDLTELDENTPIEDENPQDFLSLVAIQWQDSLQKAVDYGLSVVPMRFGVVLKQDEGILKSLKFSFHWGLGAILGDGKQPISWIHIDDLVRAIQFLMVHPELDGPINLTSPCPVTQREFAKTLAKTLHRPLLLKLPAGIIRLIFGEMGTNLLLQGQRVVPTRLLNAGFQFQYPKLSNALQREFHNQL